VLAANRVPAPDTPRLRARLAAALDASADTPVDSPPPAAPTIRAA
jgi:hypothetical protein